jgi:hypothetical protein
MTTVPERRREICHIIDDMPFIEDVLHGREGREKPGEELTPRSLLARFLTN